MIKILRVVEIRCEVSENEIVSELWKADHRRRGGCLSEVPDESQERGQTLVEENHDQSR